MSGQPNISQILAALAQRPPGGTPTQSQHLSQQPSPAAYPPSYPPQAPPAGAQPYHIPQPSSSGSIDLSNVRPVNSGSVSLADAVSRARGIAAEKDLSYDRMRSGGTPNRDVDPRSASRNYRRSRSRSRSPPRIARDNFRDNYNPYRDERRDDPRRGNPMPHFRERSFSPGIRQPEVGSRFSPNPGRNFVGPGDRSPLGRRPVEDNSETITIDSGLVGLIIGRQGENLRRVEADTSSRVQFLTGPESSGPLRQCKITGTRVAREDAKAEIFRIIEENGNTVSASAGNRAPVADRVMGGSAKTVGAHQPALRAGEDATQIMVPNRTVGLIIGRGGETIRDLQEKSQCHVNIVGEEKSVNNLRPVNLIGTPQAAAMAKDLIMEIVESDTKSLANQGGAPHDRSGGPPAFGASDSDKINDRIMVPSEAVGMIIGKGGETIKDMQTTTGCKINVSPASGQDFERDIGLVGSRDSIEQAKRAIMEKVHAVEKNRSGGGGNRDRDDRQHNGQFSQTQPSYNQQVPQSDPSAGDADPYAPYGGYQNYVALWYSSMQQHGQQNLQNQGPPGS